MFFDFWTANVFDAADVVTIALLGALAREGFGRFFAKRRKVEDPLDGMMKWKCLVCEEKGTPTSMACNDVDILQAMVVDHMEYFHPGVDRGSTKSKLE